jgi:glycosyltransferase involved in cell wall biosynthesis
MSDANPRFSDADTRDKRPLKVLIVHNFYQNPGGEDGVFFDEAKLLESHGHEVIRFSVHNDRVKDQSALSLARDTVWNSSIHAELKAMVRKERPDVAHFHNTFPIVSPAAYYAVREEGVAVVQTLHNFRMLCPGSTFFREGQICEKCLGKTIPWPSLVHKCYRGSLGATGATTVMIGVHRARGTLENQVDAYIAMTEFSRSKFIAGGLPGERIHVKPNFVDESLAAAPGTGSGGYGVFVGRLIPEKGVPTVLKAWRLMHNESPPPPLLNMLGLGTLKSEVEAAAAEIPSIKYLGQIPPADVFSLLREAQFLVFPSEWYEPFGRIAAEAFAAGTPVLASNLGSLAQMIDSNRTGLLFEPGNPASLAAAVRKIAENPDLSQMRFQARREYETRYTAKANYEMLTRVYESAVEHRRSRDQQPQVAQPQQQLAPVAG